jgi:hypothetical protein
MKRTVIFRSPAGSSVMSKWSRSATNTRSGPMINKAVSIRIMSIRCAWRHGYQDLLRHGRKDNRLTGMLSLGVPKTHPLKIGIPLRRSTPPS